MVKLNKKRYSNTMHPNNCYTQKGKKMKNTSVMLIILLFIPSFSYAEKSKQVTDRNRICMLEFGKFDKNNAFVSSTPMQDACSSSHYESRKRICEFNYKKYEIINACIATYDAVTTKIKKAKKYNK